MRIALRHFEDETCLRRVGETVISKSSMFDSHEVGPANVQSLLLMRLLLLLLLLQSAN